MDDYVAFVKAQFVQVGSVVLYPDLWQAVNISPHNVQRLHVVKRLLKSQGWLTEQVQRNPTTGEMEHRITRVGG